MFKKIKKTLAITSTMALVLSMSTSVFAMGPTSGGMGNFQTTQSANVQSGKMQHSQGTNGRMQSQQNQSATAQSASQAQGTERSAQGGINQGLNGMKQEMGMAGGNRGGMITEAIAALSDEDAETLSEYISAYEDALTEKQAALEDADEDTDLSSYREAVHTALQALLDTAEDEDIDLGSMSEGFQGQMMNGTRNRRFTEAITALSDEDAETLSGYISAYEDALTEKQAALEDADEDTDLSSYREAVHTALQALLDAAEDEDIDLGSIGSMSKRFHGQMMNGAGNGRFTEAIAALSDEDAETLSGYISAYEDALDEELAALEDADEDTDLSSYREAVQTALQALLAAAKDADIDL
ncbi:MAG: hypothetical protein PHU31_10285 [Anaerotignum sp.]|nr:hypothetical protein [Anaerotignum sp.]